MNLQAQYILCNGWKPCCFLRFPSGNYLLRGWRSPSLRLCAGVHGKTRTPKFVGMTCVKLITFLASHVYFIYMKGGKMRKRKRTLMLKRVIKFLWKHKKMILNIVFFIIKIINALFKNNDD